MRGVDPDMAGEQRNAAQFLDEARGFGGVGERQVERRGSRHRFLGSMDPIVAPGGVPAQSDRIGKRRQFGKLVAVARQRPEHAVDELARATVDQRQHGRNRRVRRGAERQRLHQRDAQRKARLGIIGQSSLGRRIDQRVEIGQPSQHLRRDRVGQRSVIGAVDPSGRAADRGFERQALAENRVEHPERSAACGDAGGLDGFGAGHVTAGGWQGHGLELFAKDRQLTGDALSHASARKSLMAARPPHVKPPAYLSKNTPVPAPDPKPEPRDTRDHLGLDPTRYGDWEHKGIAIDF